MPEIVSLSEEIAAPIGQVWAVIAAFGAVKAWMPDVASCALDGDGSAGSVRLVTLKGAPGVVAERLEALRPADHTVVYSILTPAQMPVEGFLGTITLTAAGEGATRLAWRAQTEKVTGGATVADLAPTVDAFYRNSLRGLKALLA
jgi:carbon monoxide dehydrogenase subunit G